MTLCPSRNRWVYDYDKVLGTMKEAMWQLEKLTANDKEVKLSLMRIQVIIFQKFVHARESLNNNDSPKAMQICD